MHTKILDMKNINEKTDGLKQLINSETITVVTILIISAIVLAFSSIVLLGIKF